MADFVGAGWAFPITVDVRGRVSLSRGERDVEEAIRIILGTSKGQRVMRPEFGSLLHTLVFAPNDATTAGLAVHYVQDALAMWEPRIQLLGVDAHLDPEDSARLFIAIRYEIKSTLDSRTLVYPFYRLPESPKPGLLLEKGDENATVSA
ncbi:MAG: GPW/gp25 family protein [Alloacidobacterium sp.]